MKAPRESTSRANDVPPQTAPPRIVPRKPIRQPITLAPGVTVVVTAPADKWPLIKWDGAYVSIDASPEAKDVAPVRRSESRRTAPPPLPRGMSGDPTEPSGTIEASLPGDDDVAERSARKIESDTFEFLRGAEKSILRKGDV